MNEENFWIVVPKWDDFQHYKHRDPRWIKCYTRLLADDDYLGLTAPQRGVLHGLWMLYAKSGRKVSVNTAKLSRKLGVRVTKHTLQALNDAGFIEFRASSVLAQSREEKSIKSFSNISNPRELLTLLKTGTEES